MRELAILTDENSKLPSIKDMYDDWDNGSASAHASRQKFCILCHAPVPSTLGLEAFEQQVLLGKEDRGTICAACLSRKPATHQLVSSSSCHGPPMALLPSPNTFQVPPLAIQPRPVHPNSSASTMLIGAGWQEDQMDPPPRRSQYESVMQTSVQSRVPTQRTKGKFPDRSRKVQAADKKAQAEKHRKSEQKRRKGTSCEITNMEWHIPKVFLDRIKSRSIKLRHTNGVPVSVSRPSKNGVLGKGVIYMKAMEDDLTAAYEHNQQLRDAIAAKDKLIQGLTEALDSLNVRPARQYLTPPESPKPKKRCRPANSLEAGRDFETPWPPSKQSKYKTYDTDAEWTDLEEGWQDLLPKPHEGQAWDSNVIARMESIERCLLRGSSDVSPATMEGMSTPTSIDVDGHLKGFAEDQQSELLAPGYGCSPSGGRLQALPEYQ